MVPEGILISLTQDSVHLYPGENLGFHSLLSSVLCNLHIPTK